MRLLNALLHPGSVLQEQRRSEALPWPLWSPLGAIAILGSLLYGASLSLRLPWSRMGAALWLTLASGLGWLALGPLLRAATGLPWRLLATACLLTMAYGEAVLQVGALLNLVWSMPAPGLVNLLIVLVSNAAMGSALALQLRGLGVPVRRTWLCWLLGLDGSGTLFFLLFRFLLTR
jgi:hypothetical protein